MLIDLDERNGLLLVESAQYRDRDRMIATRNLQAEILQFRSDRPLNQMRRSTYVLPWSSTSSEMPALEGLSAKFDFYTDGPSSVGIFGVLRFEKVNIPGNKHFQTKLICIVWTFVKIGKCYPNSELNVWDQKNTETCHASKRFNVDLVRARDHHARACRTAAINAATANQLSQKPFSPG
jgi:hypothetical protein